MSNHRKEMALFRKILLCLFASLMLALSLPVMATSINYVECKYPGYSCIKVKAGQSWRALFSDDYERAIIKRINHWNGYTYKGQVIKVPDNIENASLEAFSPFAQHIEAPNEKLIVFDPQSMAFAAYSAEGELIKWGPATGGAKKCSGGKDNCYTKPGEFRLYSLGSSTCASSKYPQPDGGAPMPYCMFFNGGQAFHGSPNGVRNAHRSHGCVRLFVRDAEWLRYDFAEGPNSQNNFRGTKVVVLPYKKMEEEGKHDTV